MQQKKFQRTKEDFTCMQCGNEVEGTGYTNHCPKCLYGKHVDINPGDRAEECGGLMKPVAAVYSGKAYTLQQQCIECEKKIKVRSAANDDSKKLMELTANVLYD